MNVIGMVAMNNSCSLLPVSPLVFMYVKRECELGFVENLKCY